jgi:MFS superfamily sulfate permease-like transporter
MATDIKVAPTPSRADSKPEARKLPLDGMAGLKQNWKSDIVSGFILFLLALPLSLGIALASGVPPMAGLIAAAFGGMLVSQVNGSFVTITGPAAGLIVVILGTVERLGGGAEGYHCALAAIVVAGLTLFALGKLKAGQLGEFFPLSVVHGMLSAIGIIIMSKQFHIMLGVKPEAKEPLGLIAEIPKSLTCLNPEIALIGLTSLAILILISSIKNKRVRSLPAPLIVVVIAVAMGFYFDLEHKHQYIMWGNDYMLDPAKTLVLLPNNVLDAITLPDFSKVPSLAFWFSVLSITFVQGLETLLSAAAIDKLDPYKRKSDLSKDVAGVGLGSAVSGLIGGLPMISEIVRSTANIAAGAKTRWSNFFHGLFIFAFVLAASSIIDLVPMASLAAILVVTGFRLASPKVFKETFAIGPEQMVLFLVTIIATLSTDLLVGVSIGIATKFFLHLWAGVPPSVLFKADLEIVPNGPNTVVLVKKAAVFSNYISLKNKLNSLARTGTITVDFSQCNFIDHTVMERLHEYAADYEKEGGKLVLSGLDVHKPNTVHPLAARRLPSTRQVTS